MGSHIHTALKHRIFRIHFSYVYIYTYINIHVYIYIYICTCYVSIYLSLLFISCFHVFVHGNTMQCMNLCSRIWTNTVSVAPKTWARDFGRFPDHPTSPSVNHPKPKLQSPSAAMRTSQGRHKTPESRNLSEGAAP